MPVYRGGGGRRRRQRCDTNRGARGSSSASAGPRGRSLARAPRPPRSKWGASAKRAGVPPPPVPAFYAKPQSLDEMIDQTLGRILDLFGLDAGTVRRWGEPASAGAPKLRAKPRRRSE